MTPEHEAHLLRVLTSLVRDVDVKYRFGQLEHGGRLWEKTGMLDHAIEEVLDLSVYLYTLREQAQSRNELTHSAHVSTQSASKQTRRMSLIETLVNIAVGYGIACFAQMLIFKQLGIHVETSTNLWMGGVFTGISLVRSYTLRRIFNWL